MKSGLRPGFCFRAPQRRRGSLRFGRRWAITSAGKTVVSSGQEVTREYMDAGKTPLRGGAGHEVLPGLADRVFQFLGRL
jgi:hypothetical protein